MKLQARVCILGSGVAGGVVAQELLNRGVKDILMLEAGSPVTMQDRRVWYDHVTNEVEPLTAHYYSLADYINAGKSPIEIAGKAVRARGGSTLAWGGMSYRLKPEDFRLKTNTGKGVDWPISYTDLEPYYALSEQTLQVSGEAKDPGHPPRSGPFPMAPFPAQEIEEPFIRAMIELGFSTQHSCIARNTRSINGMAQCQRTSTCQYCPLGARFTGDQLIARLEERPGFRLMTNTVALKLQFASKEVVASVDVQGGTGERHTVEAETFVICAGALESPKLLLVSTDRFWPKGVGNDHGLVGRFLTDHVFQGCNAKFQKPNPTRLSAQLWFETTTSRHFDDVKMQASGKFMLMPANDSLELLYPMMHGKTTAEIARALDNPTTYGTWFQMEEHPSEENFLALGTGRDAIGLPKTVINHSLTRQALDGAQAAREICEKVLKKMGGTDPSWNAEDLSGHVVGTCRMSDSPAAGVVDRDLKVHDTKNLYLCSNAVFPTVGAVNPTVTVTALSHRLGEHLGGQAPTKRP